MPLSFSSIPEHLRIDIVQKLKFEDYLNYQESSLESYNFSQRIRTRFLYVEEGLGLHLTVQNTNGNLLAKRTFHETEEKIIWSRIFEFPLRFEGCTLKIDENVQFNDEFCILLREYLLNTNSSAKCLMMDSIDFSIEAFNDLYDSGKVAGLSLTRDFTSFNTEVFRLRAFKEMNNLSLRSPVKDEDLMILRMPDIYLIETDISVVGLNTLIKECQNGQRRVSIVGIHTFNAIDDVDALLDGISYSRCETWTIHRHVYIIKNNADSFQVVFLRRINFFVVTKIQHSSQEC